MFIPKPIYDMLNSSNLILQYQNVSCLRTKTSEIYLQSLLAECDIIVLTETWLKAGIYDAELFHSSYNVFRKDRNYELMGLERGGGVLLASKGNLEVKQEIILGIDDTDCDYICVQVKIPGSMRKMLIAVFYFTPNTTTSTYAHVCDMLTIHISQIQELVDILILGDFNIPSFTRVLTGQNNCDNNCDKANTLYDFMHVNDLTSHNTIANKFGKTLDLILSSTSKTDVQRTESLTRVEDPYHSTLQITVQICKPQLINKHTQSQPITP